MDQFFFLCQLIPDHTMALQYFDTSGISYRQWKKTMTPFCSGAHPHMNDVCPVRIGDCGAKGRGVFATRDVKEGDVLTYYPCHIVRTSSPIIGMSSKDPSYAGGTWCSVSDCDHSRVGELVSSGEYTYSTTDESFIGLPEKTDDPWFLGHMLNDSVCITSKTRGSILQQGTAYERVAVAKNNAAFEQHLRGGNLHSVSIVASRDIKCGDEVSVTYGSLYWLGKFDKRARLKINLARLMMAKGR